MLVYAKVQKPGAVIIMGGITALFYFITGQFTMVILITFTIACGLAEMYYKRVKQEYITKKGRV